MFDWLSNMQNNTFLAQQNGFSVHEKIRSIPVVVAKMSVAPRLSIMIPTYRRPALLKEAIESALAQQTEVPYEVCVVDNDTSASDEVETVVRSFNSPNLSLYRNEENIGMFGNWNRCIQLANGEYVSILNDDDRLAPYFIQKSFECVSGDALVFCSYHWFGQAATAGRTLASSLKLKLNSLFRSERISVPELIWAYPLVGTLGVIINKRAGLALGGFWPDHFPISDRIFLSRYMLAYGAVPLKERLAYYRWEANESLRESTAKRTFEMECGLRELLISGLVASDNVRRKLQTINEVVNSARLSKLEHQFGHEMAFEEPLRVTRGRWPSKISTLVIGMAVSYAQLLTARHRVKL